VKTESRLEEQLKISSLKEFNLSRHLESHYAARWAWARLWPWSGWEKQLTPRQKKCRKDCSRIVKHQTKDRKIC